MTRRTDLDFFTRGGNTYASVGTLGQGNNRGTIDFKEAGYFIPVNANTWTSHVFKAQRKPDGTFTYWGATGDFNLGAQGRSAIDVYKVTLPGPPDPQAAPAPRAHPGSRRPRAGAAARAPTAARRSPASAAWASSAGAAGCG